MRRCLMTFSRPDVAVLPVAGLSTRNLPATKVMHKGFLCLNSLPIIQYAVNACVEAGIKEIVFVYSDDANRLMYERYFSEDRKLKELLIKQNKMQICELVDHILPKDVKFSFAQQSEPKGNGHAVLCAKDIIGKRDFVVMWVDDVYICPHKGILSQLMDVYEQRGGIVENVIKYPKEELIRYGVLQDITVSGNIVSARGVIEKPRIDEITSDYASMGPYILPNIVLQLLPQVSKGNNGEINLTDAINLAAHQGIPFSGVLTDSERYDCGTNDELAKSNIRLSIRQNKELYDEAVKTINYINK